MLLEVAGYVDLSFSLDANVGISLELLLRSILAALKHIKGPHFPFRVVPCQLSCFFASDCAMLQFLLLVLKAVHEVGYIGGVTRSERPKLVGRGVRVGYALLIVADGRIHLHDLRPNCIRALALATIVTFYSMSLQELLGSRQ